MFPLHGMALLHSTHFWYPVLFLIFSMLFATCTFLVQMGLIITASSESAADIISNTKQTWTIDAILSHRDSVIAAKQRNVWSLSVDHDLVLWATFFFKFSTLCHAIKYWIDDLWPISVMHFFHPTIQYSQLQPWNEERVKPHHGLETQHKTV